MTRLSYQLSDAENDRIFQTRIVPDELEGAPSQRSPVVVFVGGQTGAGKTALTELVQPILDRRGGAVNINMDTYNPYHPAYASLRARDPETASAHVRADGESWWDKAQTWTIQHRCDVLIETALLDESEYEHIAARYAAAGFRVETALMAVSPALSRLGILWRFQQQVETVGHGRLVDPGVHDACVAGVERAVGNAERHRFTHQLFLFERGPQAVYANHLNHRGDWAVDSDPVRALHAAWVRPFTEPELRQFERQVRILEAQLAPERRAELDNIRRLAIPHLVTDPGAATLAGDRASRAAVPGRDQATTLAGRVVRAMREISDRPVNAVPRPVPPRPGKPPPRIGT